MYMIDFLHNLFPPQSISYPKRGGKSWTKMKKKPLPGLGAKSPSNYHEGKAVFISESGLYSWIFKRVFFVFCFNLIREPGKCQAIRRTKMCKCLEIWQKRGRYQDWPESKRMVLWQGPMWGPGVWRSKNHPCETSQTSVQNSLEIIADGWGSLIQPSIISFGKSRMKLFQNQATWKDILCYPKKGST